MSIVDWCDDFGSVNKNAVVYPYQPNMRILFCSWSWPIPGVSFQTGRLYSPLFVQTFQTGVCWCFPRSSYMKDLSYPTNQQSLLLYMDKHLNAGILHPAGSFATWWASRTYSSRIRITGKFRVNEGWSWWRRPYLAVLEHPTKPLSLRIGKDDRLSTHLCVKIYVVMFAARLVLRKPATRKKSSHPCYFATNFSM